MGQRLAYWLLIGVAGFSVYFLLRGSVDFHAQEPIRESRSTVEQRTDTLAERLGFSSDSLALLTVREQHMDYYRLLKDSLAGSSSIPVDNYGGQAHLSGWNVIIGKPLEEEEVAPVNRSNLFERVGLLQLKYDNYGKLRRIVSNPDKPNPTFVAGDSLTAIAGYLVEDILEYNLSYYSLPEVNIKDPVSGKGGGRLQPGSGNLGDMSRGDNTEFEFTWTKSEKEAGGPQELELVLQPLIKEVGEGQGTDIKYGASVVEFKALDTLEPASLSARTFTGNTSFIFSFGSLGLLVIMVFFTGIRHINRGQVEWKRALFVLVVVALGMISWRLIYLMNHMGAFFNDTAALIYILNTIITGGLTGLYASLAYIGWEAMNRSDSREEIKLADAFWRKRFFFRETGESLLKGYALGGVLLGTLALGLYLLNLVYYQADSEFGYAEASMQPQLLTVNMGALFNVWLVALGHVGVTMGLLRQYVEKRWMLYLVGTVVLGFLIAGSATLIATDGPIWKELIVYTAMAPLIMYAVRESGLLSFSTGWWIFVLILMITPFLGSPSTDVAYVAWVQFGVLALPFVYGFVAWRYGSPIAVMGSYTPEYQERMANHLRVEKEIEIARESQFKLMPLKPPVLDGVDVYGFFMPSFEVGGDYFDYVVNQNGNAEPEALTMTIADVSGKSMKAAMHAVFTSGLLLSRLHRDRPENILREVAPTLHMRTDPQTFITCVIARYSLKNSILSIANAGHCQPIIKRGGKAEFIRTPDPRYPLGLKAHVDYGSLELNLKPGDFLFLYSDGLPEAVDPDGNRFGFEYLLEVIEEMDTTRLSCNEIALEIKRRVQKFSDYQLADDTTLICLKV